MDKYNIPGDTGGYWRIDQLIEYKEAVDYVDVSTLREYVKKSNLTKDELILVAWYFSMTYSEVSAFWLLDNLDFYGLTKTKLEHFWKTYKPIMQFSSSRVYCKSMDWFVPLMENFVKITHKKPYKWYKRITETCYTPEERYIKVFNTLKGWKFMGRFSCELFLLALEAFNEVDKFEKIITKEMPFSWKNGSNETSGMFNLIYMDDEADEFDRSGFLDKELIERLDEGLDRLNRRCEEKGFIQRSYTSILPRICSFRNVFKARRYAGYHHDRQLEQLRAYRVSGTDIRPIKRIYSLRSQIYPKQLLGEIGGWDGIRNEKKKLFITKGVLWE